MPTVTIDTSNTTVNWSVNATSLSRTLAILNSVRVTSIGLYNTQGARTFTMKIVQRTGAGNYDIVKSQASFSHPSGGWADFTFTTPYDVPASGTFYCAAYNANTGLIDGILSAARSFKTGDLTGAGQTGFTEDTGQEHCFRYTYSVLAGVNVGNLAMMGF